MPDFSTPSLLRALIALAAILVVVAAIDAAQSLLAPIFAAIVTGIMFGPTTDKMEARGMPLPLASLIVLIFLAVVGGLLFVALEPTISHAIANGPMIWSELRSLVQFVRDALSGVQELQEQVTEALADDTGASAPAPQEEAMNVPGVADALSYGPSVLAGILLYVGSLYFFLATRMSSYRGTARLFPAASADLFLAAERQVSRYFLAITIVNAGFGGVTFVIMTVLGMPQPALWGIAVFVANFILYLGPACVAVALLVVGIVTFDGVMSFVPMGCFLVLNIIEAQFVTPTFVGKQMSLNPFLVFLSLASWLWLWGPIGGLLAIPVLVWMMFVFSNKPVELTQTLPAAEPAKVT